jgi:hypothetical protein
MIGNTCKNEQPTLQLIDRINWAMIFNCFWINCERMHARAMNRLFSYTQSPNIEQSHHPPCTVALSRYAYIVLCLCTITSIIYIHYGYPNEIEVWPFKNFSKFCCTYFILLSFIYLNTTANILLFLIVCKKKYTFHSKRSFLHFVQYFVFSFAFKYLII